MYQKIINWFFRFFQKRLKPDPKSKYYVLKTYEEVCSARAELKNYPKIEVSKVIHNIGEPNEYICIVFVGKK